MVARKAYESAAAGGGSGVVAAALLAGFLGSEPLLAQDDGNVTVNVRDCVELKSAEERIACFGAQVDAAIGGRGASESDDSSSAIRADEADRGRTARGETRAPPDVHAADRIETRAVDEPRRSDVEVDADEAEYHGTITAIRERLPSAYVITLDNGQVWQQVEPKMYPLRPGLEVRIYPSRWGDSYRLSGEGSGSYIQVRRVR